MNVRVIFALIGLVLVWSSAFSFIKLSIGDGKFSPGAMALFRFLTASACFPPVLFLMKKRMLPERKDIPALVFIGIIGIPLYHLPLNFGMQTVSSGASALLVSTSPVITAVGAHYILGERLTLWSIVGLVISFSGVALVIWADSPVEGINLFSLLILISAVAGAGFAIFQKKLLKRYSPLEIVAFSTWFGTLFLLGWSVSLFNEIQIVEPVAIGSVIYLGIIPAALGYMLFSYALAGASANYVSAYIYLIPVVNFVYSRIILGEEQPYLTYFGGAVVIGGVALVDYARRLQAIQEEAEAAISNNVTEIT